MDTATQSRRSKASRKGTARDRLLKTASKLLHRDGFNGLTMEKVAAASGIAKTTLYRHWPTKAALCMDIYLAEAGRELHDPDTGKVADDLKYVVNTVVRLQTRTVAGPAFLGLIAQAQIDPSSRDAFLAEFAHRRRALTRAIIDRAIERGEIRAGVDVDLVIDLLGGATTFRLLQGHAPLNARFADALVSLVLSGAGRRQ